MSILDDLKETDELAGLALQHSNTWIDRTPETTLFQRVTVGNQVVIMNYLIVLTENLREMEKKT